jgi:Transposase DDE domain group 1
MGESNLSESALVCVADKAVSTTRQTDLSVATPGGKFQIRWDEGGSASALGQLGFFAEYLEFTGLFGRWVSSCPLRYTSPNAPTATDVLGTWMLSILDGQRRYAHVTGLRGDAVAPQILGMKKMVSDESLRRALMQLAPHPAKRCTDTERAACAAQLARTSRWMDQALLESTRAVLAAPWVLDVDTTVKPLYGHQASAEVGYNPTKPGRPSHSLHTYWIANIRMVLDVEVQSGKAVAAKHSMPRLGALLQQLQPEERPSLVRGDSAFGNESVMAQLEEMGQDYLFKLRQTKGVKRLIEHKWQEDKWQKSVGHGFDAATGELKLVGWQRARRVVVLRRRVKENLIVEKCLKNGQAEMAFIERNDPLKLWEYVVLVTNSDYDLVAIGQLYRDRADCENGFDELKNQWGWGGYTTQDLERCNLSARAVALIYNWWSWYVRLANPKSRLEAITSRPLLLAGVARLTEHAGQSRLLVSISHAAVDKIKVMICNVRNGLDAVLTATPQLPKLGRWQALVRYIVNKIIELQPKYCATGKPPPLVLGLEGAG